MKIRARAMNFSVKKLNYCFTQISVPWTEYHVGIISMRKE